MHQQVGRKRTVQYGCTLNYFACSNFHLLRVPILTIDSRYQVPSISNINSDSDTKRTSGSLAKWAHWRNGSRELPVPSYFQVLLKSTFRIASTGTVSLNKGVLWVPFYDIVSSVLNLAA